MRAPKINETASQQQDPTNSGFNMEVGRAIFMYLRVCNKVNMNYSCVYIFELVIASFWVAFFN